MKPPALRQMQVLAETSWTGILAENVALFARALRKAGLPIGPGQVAGAIRAVEVVGFTTQDDFSCILQGCFVSRPEQRQVFDQVFRLFWRDPRFMEQMMSLLLPSLRTAEVDRVPSPAEKRAAQALLDGVLQDNRPRPEPAEDLRLDMDASQTASAQERLRSLDFEQMSVAELAEAKRMLANLRLPIASMTTRRFQMASHGARIDLRKSLRAGVRAGGEVTRLYRTAPRPRWPNLVVLCDISGSMAQYSRMVLHFLHAVANARGQGWAGVHGFTFGTRLTNITRHLAQRDVDAALAAAGAQAQDWSGGTRIGSCLHSFNRDWSRRVLGQGAVVLLITDGLDRDDPAVLRAAMQRLHLSARRLIWLNPLLRWDGFSPLAQGIKVMLPLVDTFRSAHSVASLEGLAQTLSDARDAGEKQRMLAMMDLQ